MCSGGSTRYDIEIYRVAGTKWFAGDLPRFISSLNKLCEYQRGRLELHGRREVEVPKCSDDGGRVSIYGSGWALFQTESIGGILAVVKTYIIAVAGLIASLTATFQLTGLNSNRREKRRVTTRPGVAYRSSVQPALWRVFVRRGVSYSLSQFLLALNRFRYSVAIILTQNRATGDSKFRLTSSASYPRTRLSAVCHTAHYSSKSCRFRLDFHQWGLLK